jgi:hypothetical protein
LARTGFFKPVHGKSLPAHAVRSRTTIRTTRPSVDSGVVSLRGHAGVRGGFRRAPKLYGSSPWMRDPISEDGEPSRSPRWTATRPNGDCGLDKVNSVSECRDEKAVFG